MYKKYIEQLEEAGKIRNLKDRSIHCYKNYVSYFLNYTSKCPKELTCQDVRDFLLAKKDSGLKSTTLNLYNSKRQRTQIDNSESLQFCTPLFLPECPAHPLG